MWRGSIGQVIDTSTSPVRTMRTAPSVGRQPVEQIEEDEQQVDVVGAEQIVGGEIERQRGAALAVALAGEGERDLAAVGARAEEGVGPRRDGRCPAPRASANGSSGRRPASTGCWASQSRIGTRAERRRARRTGCVGPVGAT